MQSDSRDSSSPLLFSFSLLLSRALLIVGFLRGPVRTRQATGTTPRSGVLCLPIPYKHTKLHRERSLANGWARSRCRGSICKPPLSWIDNLFLGHDESCLRDP
ncbi:hypothetical protein BO99DRAFT_204957 [Aspergillus violaceofuscus CBS 115571]|uniref:Uncharacterized protein n=1 Tax=Aspergillus violaceofuscus (strain CBS 115571) TaxID=1450538 RepID=A0A2V5H833_ASPV1|nr:hypothetical protein BO99DRAFT_204957 [Aspergillus violaceofuscus CBS 115571]